MHITHTLHAHTWCCAKTSSYRPRRGDSGHDSMIGQRDSSAIIYETTTRVTVCFDKVKRQAPWRQFLAILARLLTTSKNDRLVARLWCRLDCMFFEIHSLK